MKKYNENIESLAIKYQVELYEQLYDLNMRLKVKNRYKGWTLQDCYVMHKFYLLVINGNYKAAFNKLKPLYKEAGLVPNDLAKLIFNMYKNE